MPDHYWRHILLRPRQENGGAGDTRNLIFFDLLHEFANLHDRLVSLTGSPRLLKLREVGCGRAGRRNEANHRSECAHVLRFQ
jgi:hypothetical protein